MEAMLAGEHPNTILQGEVGNCRAYRECRKNIDNPWAALPAAMITKLGTEDLNEPRALAIVDLLTLVLFEEFIEV
jgi:hypothetical protein